MLAPAAVSVATARRPGLDVLRGAAIAAMIVDHLCVVFLAPQGDLIRVTLGRVAMPLFFLVSGALVRRFGWRHVGVGAIGVVLPLVAPWLDRPNVLVIYMLGAGLIVLARYAQLPLPLLVVLPLIGTANGWTATPHGFDVGAVVAIMAVGAMIGPRLGDRVPHVRPLAVLGRYPLSIYVGHVLALCGVAYLLAG